MKRIFTLLFAVIFSLSMITVSANMPDALSNIQTNYTSNYKISFSFESSDGIISLLDEMQMPEEVYNFVDLKALLKSLLTNESVMTVQADINEDFTKINIGLTTDSFHTVDVNKNLNIDINSKMGMWMKLDLAAAEPVCEIIYSHPFLNKYMVMDLFEIAADEAEKEQIADILKSVLNKEFLLKIQQYSVDVIEKYADVKVRGGNCVIKIDNEAFTSIMDDVMKYSYDIIEEVTTDIVNPDAEAGIKLEQYNESLSFKGMQFLGKDGITVNYSLAGGRITGIDMDAAIELNVANIYTNTTGDEWEYQNEGVMNFNVSVDASVYNFSKTKVDFPVLTEENSFDFMDLVPQPEYEDDYYYEEYEPEYPNYWSYGETAYLPVINGKIYVPLRQAVYSAYEDYATVTYDNGVIAATSDYFPGFGTIILTIDSNTAYTDGIAHYIDTVVKINNVTYVSADMFKQLFGWELNCASYDMLNGLYYYEFYTE